jgi:hypothetical protein
LELDLQSSLASRAARHSQHQAPYQPAFCWNQSAMTANGPPSRAGCYLQFIQIVGEFSGPA